MTEIRDHWLKKAVRWLLRRLYQVKVVGLEHFAAAGARVLIVANHTSYLDPVLLWAFLPGEVTFAIDTRVARRWWVSPALRWVRAFPMDPTSPLSVKALTNYLKGDRKAVIFPEGRITVTGALMKVYDGAALIADMSGAMLLPVRIDGAQYTPFSRLHGVVRLRWFPKISLNILPPTTLDRPTAAGGPSHSRRREAGTALADLMSEMIFATGERDKTLFAALLDARRVHGGRRRVLEDVRRRPLSYHRLIAQALVLGKRLSRAAPEETHIGALLPSASGTVAVLLGLQIEGRVPALLNYGAGIEGLVSACRVAAVRTVVTSRRFLETAKLTEAAEPLQRVARLLFLEDLLAQVTAWERLAALAGALSADWWYRRRPEDAGRAAVTLFTFGSEGDPKGVVLSHANLLSNREQIAARVDFNAQDIILNALPMYHAFGLTAGTLLPLLSGMRTFLYPSPLHYRVIPEVAYDINATILFGTSTFLSGYAKHAHPYDFYSVRYVFAGAEKLQEDTRRQWTGKFGIRVLEGYGATETSPVLAVNTSMHYRQGTVGRFLPGIQYRLEAVPGVTEGGRLHVAGPNVMLGYLLAEQPGRLVPPESCFGAGWYDTGDIVSVDENGFVTIHGRAKRFAKVGGEMVSLARIEELAARVWPQALHAALRISDPRKGEQILLVTDHPNADRGAYLAKAQAERWGELFIPKEIIVLESMPLLATGKVDYPAVERRLAGRDFLVTDAQSRP